MPRFRLHLGTLFIVVLVLGVGFAALRESSEHWYSAVFTLTLCSLLISTLFAVHRTEKQRAFWSGFVLFGAVYLVLSLVPSIESRLLTTKALAYIDSTIPRLITGALAHVDLDNDGDVDIYVVNHSQGNMIYRNQGNGMFEDLTANAGLNPAGNQVTGSNKLWVNAPARLWVRSSVGTAENFMRIGHSLAALIIAFVGGQLSRCLHSRSVASTPV
jgi:hypothetical protein